jgi:hypothetical protein
MLNEIKRGPKTEYLDQATDVIEESQLESIVALEFRQFEMAVDIYQRLIELHDRLIGGSAPPDRKVAPSTGPLIIHLAERQQSVSQLLNDIYNVTLTLRRIL